MEFPEGSNIQRSNACVTNFIESDVFLPLVLPVQLCRPVQNDRHGRGFRLLNLRDDQEALAVAAHVVDRVVITRHWLTWTHLEKHG